MQTLNLWNVMPYISFILFSTSNLRGEKKKEKNNHCQSITILICLCISYMGLVSMIENEQKNMHWTSWNFSRVYTFFSEWFDYHINFSGKNVDDETFTSKLNEQKSVMKICNMMRLLNFAVYRKENGIDRVMKNDE